MIRMLNPDKFGLKLLWFEISRLGLPTSARVGPWRMIWFATAWSEYPVSTPGAITLLLREAGVMRGGVFSGEALELTPQEQLEAVLAGDVMEGQSLSDRVSVSAPRVVTSVGASIGVLAVLDLGYQRINNPRVGSQGL